MENMKTEEQPKRNFKKRLLILILLLLITGVMLSTSTYAWFTANETVSVSNIRVNVAAQNGIQISADGTNWKSILQTTDLTTVHTTTYTTAINQIPTTLEPVSTIGTINTGKLEMWYGEVKTSGNDFILTASTAGERDNNDTTTVVTNPGKFIAFDVFLKVTATTPVYLTSASGITTDDVADSGIKNASRVGFLTLGNVADGTALTTIQALGATGTPTLIMWEPNYNAHTAAGVANARDIYGKTTAVTSDTNTALTYDGVKAAITEANNIKLTAANATANATQFQAVTPALQTKDTWTGAAPTQYLSLFTLQAGITKVRMYVWVEGQDVDCENTASGGNIIFNMQITTNNGT
jgi:predicted ribosomally synthesized peptide with SipW-like signal peptide